MIFAIGNDHAVGAAHPDANIIFGAMVDDKLDDQVWVAVVATGYQETSRPARQTFQEPAGEPRVQRRDRERERPRSGLASVSSLDVPEFIPRGR